MINSFFQYLIVLLLFLLSCSSSQSEKSETPACFGGVGKKCKNTEDTIFFCSSRSDFVVENDAKEAVINDVYSSLAAYSLMSIDSSSSSKTHVSKEATDGEVRNKDRTEVDAITKTYSKGIYKGVITPKTYVESYKDNTGQQKYKAWAHAAVSIQKAQQAFDDFCKEISEKYTNRLAPQDSLYITLESYGKILDSLNKEPVDKLVAYYYDAGSGKKMALYDYVELDLSKIVSSVSFTRFDHQKIQKTDNVNVNVKLNSPYVKNFNELRCRIIIEGRDFSYKDIRGPRPIRDGNSFTLNIPTKELKTGRYQVSFELLLDNITNHISADKNPQRRFFFDVLPVAVEIEWKGRGLNNSEKNKITQSIQQRLENCKADIIIDTPLEGRQNRYSFVVTASIKEKRGAGGKGREAEAPTYYGNATVEFVCSGVDADRRTLKKLLTDDFASKSYNEVFNKIITQIEENEQFFNAVKGTVE